MLQPPKHIGIVKITDAFPTFDDLANASPERIGRALLRLLPQTGEFSVSHIRALSEEYHRRQVEAGLVLQEGWQWLVNRGLIIRNPFEMTGNFYTFARKAKDLQRDEDFETFSLTQMLSEDLLHPLIVRECLADFRQGHFAKAVQRSMTAVEDRVRKVGAIPSSVTGSVPAMRAAFSPGAGSLTNQNAARSEQVALMELYAGAMGYYREAHTLGNVDDPVEAARVLAFASDLLAVVDARSK